MKKIAIIVNEIHPLIEVMQNHMKSLGYICEFVPWDTVIWDISTDEGIKSNLDGFDLIYLDRLGEGTFSYNAQIKMYEALDKKIPVVNTPENYVVARDKALMAVYFEKFKFLHPKTFVIHNEEQMGKVLDHPTEFFVVKSTQGFCSNEVRILNREDMTSEFIKETLKRDHTLVLQEYIENPGEFIWRVDVVDGEVIVANQRFRYNDSGKPICNGTHGGRIDFYKPSEMDSKVREFCIEVCEKMGLSVAGLDIIVSPKGELYLIEVNPEPDITLDRYEFPRAIANFLIRKAN